jgi:hypothetical protein
MFATCQDVGTEDACCDIGKRFVPGAPIEEIRSRGKPAGSVRIHFPKHGEVLRVGVVHGTKQAGIHDAVHCGICADPERECRNQT